jgi:hypothetical protein
MYSAKIHGGPRVGLCDQRVETILVMESTDNRVLAALQRG